TTGPGERELDLLHPGAARVIDGGQSDGDSGVVPPVSVWRGRGHGRRRRRNGITCHHLGRCLSLRLQRLDVADEVPRLTEEGVSMPEHSWTTGRRRRCVRLPGCEETAIVRDKDGEILDA